MLRWQTCLVFICSAITMGCSASDSYRSESGPFENLEYSRVQLDVSGIAIPAMCRDANKHITVMVALHRNYHPRSHLRAEKLWDATNLAHQKSDPYLSIYLLHIVERAGTGQPLPSGIQLNAVDGADTRQSVKCMRWVLDTTATSISYHPLAIKNNDDLLVLEGREIAKAAWEPLTEENWKSWWAAVDQQYELTSLFEDDQATVN